ncbi:MAG: O-antigen ligase domain-containing protein [Bacteroidetes bacterium]|nr:MAG: O-antigen ligase domain-containing protein [Bacteroidota bacterium]
MEQINTAIPESNGKHRFPYYDYKLPIIAVISLAIMSSLMIYFGIVKENGYIVLGIIIGLTLCYFFIKYPRFWLYTITFSLFIFFRKGEEGVSTFDLITGILYIGTLYPWLFWQIAVKRKKLIENIGDWFIIAFFILLIGNSLIAVAHGVTFLDWSREYLMTTLILFYFPFKYYFNDEKHLKRLLVLLAIVCILTDFQQFYDYYTIGMTNVVYAYEVLVSARIDQNLYTASTAFGILFALYEKKFSLRILYLIFTVINGFALISSFSRTFWIILLIEIVLFLFIIPMKQKIKLIYYLSFFSLALIITVMIAFKGNTLIILKAYEYRLTSSTQGRKDPSIQARLAEYQVVLKRISEYPLGGNGFFKEFSFFNPIKKSTSHTITTHNGFFYLFYRIGIPLSLFFIFFLLFFTIKSFLLFFKIKENFYKVLSLGSFCGLIVMIVSDFSSTQFNVRDGVFVLAFTFAFTTIAEKKFFENKKNYKLQ